jgi:FkbH-like protein
MEQANYSTLSIRLSDKFGDYGLISALIAARERDALHIDTWVMSCRVLNRQVEELVANHLVRLARQSGCARITGDYVRTKRNSLVQDLLPRLGWSKTSESGGHLSFVLDVDSCQERNTRISVGLLE